MPTTAHAAFQKACHYLGLEAVLVDVDPKTFRAVPAAMEAAITDRTVLLVASAASYAHGVVDPVEEIGPLAWSAASRCTSTAASAVGCSPTSAPRRRRPALRPVGARGDLAQRGPAQVRLRPEGRVRGAVRRRGAAPKQYFACADWTGYTMVNATVQTTKSGGPLAAAWAMLHAVGDEGTSTSRARRSRRPGGWSRASTAIPVLRVLGEPEMALVAGRQRRGRPVRDLRRDERPRLVRPAPAGLPRPAGEHPPHAHGVERRRRRPCWRTSASASTPRAASPRETPGCSRRSGARPGVLDDDVLGTLLPLAGIEPGAGLPDRMAGVNALLEAMSPRLRERLLIEFLGQLFTPSAARRPECSPLGTGCWPGCSRCSCWPRRLRPGPRQRTGPQPPPVGTPRSWQRPADRCPRGERGHRAEAGTAGTPGPRADGDGTTTSSSGDGQPARAAARARRRSPRARRSRSARSSPRPAPSTSPPARRPPRPTSTRSTRRAGSTATDRAGPARRPARRARGRPQAQQMLADGVFAFAAWNAPQTEKAIVPFLEQNKIPLVGGYGTGRSTTARSLRLPDGHYGFEMGRSSQEKGVTDPASSSSAQRLRRQRAQRRPSPPA